MEELINTSVIIYVNTNKRTIKVEFRAGTLSATADEVSRRLAQIEKEVKS